MTALLLSGCSGWEVDPSGSGSSFGSGSGHSSQDKIDSSLQTYRSLHFIVSAPSILKAEQVALVSEKIYEKVMFDANLLSFKPKENYPIVIYQDALEYRNKTGNPAWSGGGTSTQILGQVLPSEREIRALTSIQTFDEVLTPSLLAHEISHLIFNEYMEFLMAEDAERLRWLNEGFATYQEMEAWDPLRREENVRLTRSFIQNSFMPLSEFTAFNPFQNAEIRVGNSTNIQIWYWQSRELVAYLIQTHGSYNFYIFLETLKSRKSLEQAILEAYPGQWRSLAELETAWKQAISLK